MWVVIYGKWYRIQELFTTKIICSNIISSNRTMLRSKTFIKKTKKGGILKIVREHYLRDDIWCSSALCDTCETETHVLETEPETTSTLCAFPHYIVPDTNVALHQVSLTKALRRIIIVDVDFCCCVDSFLIVVFIIIIVIDSIFLLCDLLWST